MAKFEIPRFRWLFQDMTGDVIACTERPKIDESKQQWVKGKMYHWINNEPSINENWRDTLIDLDVDDYDFEDGILRRIENDTTKN